VVEIHVAVVVLAFLKMTSFSC